MSKIKRTLGFVFAMIMTAVSYPLGRLIYGRKKIWLIGERQWQAQDNGYHFFKYMTENHPEKKVYYVIKKDSPQLKKVDDIGNVLYYGSFKHWLMYYGCEVVLSAHIRSLLPSDNWRYKELASKHKQNNKKQVFLQHGISKDDVKWLYKEYTKVDLFICGAKMEHDYAISQYKYSEDEAKYTGFARFDALQDFDVKDQILIMPTWRTWLVEKGCDLENSDYVKQWNKVLTDKRLIEAAKSKGCQIIFYPHSKLQFACDLFKAPDDNVVIAKENEYDVQTLLKESKILVTDTSSVYFDFAYMRKPLLYFHFDFDKVRNMHYQQGYFDYERDGFGRVEYTADDLVENLIELIDNDAQLEDKYRKRIDDFFPYYDKKNCERIYNEVIKMLEKK